MFLRFLVHLVKGDLTGVVEEGCESSGHFSLGVLDLLLSTCTCYNFGVRRFKAIQGFNGDNFSSRVLVFRGTFRKTFWMLSTKSGWLQ